MSSSSGSGGTSKKRKSGTNGDNEQQQQQQLHPLIRQPELGMNRRSLVTGMYGPRGERIRHTVQTGALCMPSQVFSHKNHSATNKHNKKHSLPGLDSVLRPTMDDSVSQRSVTLLYRQKVLAPPTVPPTTTEAPPTTTTTQWKTVAVHRILPNKNNPIAEERIRGGGEKEESSKITTTATTASTTPTTANHPTPTTNHPTPTTMPPKSVPTPTTNIPPVRPDVVATTTTSMPPSTTTTPVATTATATAANMTTPKTKPPTFFSASPTKPLVLPLSEKPKAQWTQHIPTPASLENHHPDNSTNQQQAAATTSSETMIIQSTKSTFPDWYQKDDVSTLEQTLLPEWFNHTASHRTYDSYIQTRERILTMISEWKNRTVTLTWLRKSIPGDVGSLYRLHQFCLQYLCSPNININDSTPTLPKTLQNNTTIQTTPSKKQKVMTSWTMERRNLLLQAVVEGQKQQPKTTTINSLDWSKVAQTVGHVTPQECQAEFLLMPIPPVLLVPPSTPSTTTPSTPSWKESIESIPSHVLDAIFQAATTTTTTTTPNSIQKAARLGIQLHYASTKQYDAMQRIQHVMTELLDQKMNKLETRMKFLLDDTQGMLEAERIALELERRDLYTTRCRDWFGGGT